MSRLISSLLGRVQGARSLADLNPRPAARTKNKVRATNHALTDDQVREVRKDKPFMTLKDCAAKFNVSPAVIRNIWDGINYRDVKDTP